MAPEAPLPEVDGELLLIVLAVLFTLDPVLAPPELEAIAAILLAGDFFPEA